MNNKYNNNNNYNNNNRDDMSNLPFDDFSEINSRQNSRLPTLRDKEEENKNLNEEEIVNLSVDLSGEKGRIKRKKSETSSVGSFNFRRLNSEKSSNYNNTNNNFNNNKNEEEILFEKMNFFDDNINNRKSRRDNNMKKNENIENELKDSEMLRDSFGEKVLNDLRTFREKEYEN